MEVKAIKTRVFKEGENLVDFILAHVPRLSDKSILVVTSKIAALAEGRTIKNWDQKSKTKAIYDESDWAIRTKYVWATVKDNMLVASAGIDESNANGKLILLPRNSFLVAENLRKKLKKQYKVKHLGIILSDSRIAPLRAGVLGLALGYSGFKGLRDYRGKKDIFGRKLKYTRTNIADGLATSSTLIMGEGKEQQPLAVITRAPVEFVKKIFKGELRIDIKDDMYGPLFRSFPSRALS